MSADDVRTGFDGALPEIQEIADIPQRNKYHCMNVDDYCINVIQSVNGTDLSDENKKLVQWAVLFNEMGKKDAHEVKIDDGKGTDTFRNYSTFAARIAETKMKELGFTNDDSKTVLALIKSHNYRNTHHGILQTVGEKNLDLYYVMKECENANKNPEIQQTFEKQLRDVMDGINADLSNNNRELIRVLPIKAKNLTAMGLCGMQIGKMQNMPAEHIRSTPNIYAYYKLRGHVDKYKKDLQMYAQENLKNVKQTVPSRSHSQKEKERFTKQTGQAPISSNKSDTNARKIPYKRPEKSVSELITNLTTKNDASQPKAENARGYNSHKNSPESAPCV